MTDPLADIGNLALQAVVSFGYLGLAVLLFLENLFPPIPSELILPLAGFLVRQGQLSFPGVVLAATLGATAGLALLYGAGRWLGKEQVADLIQRFGGVLRLQEQDLERVQRRFDKHGDWAVFLSHLIPATSGPVAVTAGLSHMPIWAFLGYSALGVATWNGLLVGLGWLLGGYWSMVQEWAQPLGYVALLVPVAFFLWLFWHRRGSQETARSSHG